MKKIISVILTVALIFALAATAMAAEIADCTVSADSVSAAAGGTVTVPVRVSGNRGFTNFGIALDYDREQLELLSIQTAEGETPYLCGTTAAVNTQWTGTEEKTFGYVTAALEEAATADGILFTATFHVSKTFSGTAAVQPVVQYMRSNKRLLSVFDAIPVTVVSGTVSTVLAGDYDQDGQVDMFDAMGLYGAVSAGAEFAEDDYSRLDVNQDGEINMFDVMAIYGIVSGGQE